MADGAFALCAWGDESMRIARVEVPAYLIGAVIFAGDRVEPARERMATLYRGQHKLHWYFLSGTSRDHVIETIAALDARHIIIVGRPLDPRRQERARARCLERLVWELGRSDVSSLVLEAREPGLMRRDLRTVDALRGSGGIERELRVHHGLPDEEPMLWIPDQVLGAVGASFLGDDRWFRRLAAQVVLIEVDL